VGDKILILGGTGTLGKALLEKLTERHEVIVLSRDEQKQYALKKQYPHVEFIIADIRDKSSIKHAFENVKYVFHVAALKHIDIIEENPIESVKTNILGTINVCEEALEHNVKHVIFSTTDKAIDPINVYGNCKAISEKIILNYNKFNKTYFKFFRWGNILNSSGSAIPFFIDCIKKGKSIPLTNKEMTRFFTTIEIAVNFMLENIDTRKNHFTLNMKSAYILNIITIIGELLDLPANYHITGLRSGEKLHESLISSHEINNVNSKNCLMFTKEELIILLKELL